MHPSIHSFLPSFLNSFFYPRRWGSGEPIWITSVRESSAANDSLTGTVRDVRFSNIKAFSENGILVSGGEVQPMTDLVFENVSLQIRTAGNTSCSKGVPDVDPTGCRDYRPREPDNSSVIFSETPGIYLEGNGAVLFSQTEVSFQAPMQPWWIEDELCMAEDSWAVSGLDCRQQGNESLPEKWPMSGITFTGDRYCKNPQSLHPSLPYHHSPPMAIINQIMGCQVRKSRWVRRKDSHLSGILPARERLGWLLL